MSIVWLAVGSLVACSLAWETEPMDSKQAAVALNALFTSSSPTSGVVLRQTEDFGIYCGAACYKGRAGCTSSATFFNRHIGVDNSSRFVGKFSFGSNVGVVFNTTLVQKLLGRCYYIADGESFFRYNGGCGCKASSAVWANCSSPHCPFNNIGPDGRPVLGDSPEAVRCQCKKGEPSFKLASKWGPQYFESSCFWRGPAYETSTGPFGGSEMEQFVEMRLEQAVEHPGTWDEVVIDDRRLLEVLARDPASAVLGVFFFDNHDTPKDNPKSIIQAETLQQALAAKYGVQLPVVGINQSIVVSKDRGPFFEHRLPALERASPKRVSETVIV